MNFILGSFIGYGIGYAILYGLGYKNRGYIYNIGLCLIVPVFLFVIGLVLGLALYQEPKMLTAQKQTSNAIITEADPIIEEMKAEIQAQKLKQNDINPDESIKTHHMTAQEHTDEQFTKIAHDDVESSKNLEDAFSIVGHSKPHKSAYQIQMAFTLANFVFISGIIGCVRGLRRKAKIVIIKNSPTHC